MKRTLGTIVLFVLLILTVIALTKLGTSQTSALQVTSTTAVDHENR